MSFTLISGFCPVAWCRKSRCVIVPPSVYFPTPCTGISLIHLAPLHRISVNNDGARRCNRSDAQLLAISCTVRVVCSHRHGNLSSLKTQHLNFFAVYMRDVETNTSGGRRTIVRHDPPLHGYTRMISGPQRNSGTQPAHNREQRDLTAKTAIKSLYRSRCFVSS